MAVTRKIPGGDLVLEGGTLVVLGDTPETRVRYIRQKIAARFKFYVGEWFLDQRQGVPYYRDVFKKSPDLQLIRALFVRVVRETPGVLDVPNFSLTHDTATRTVTFDFDAVVDGGVIQVRPEDRDFILDLASAS